VHSGASVLVVCLTCCVSGLTRDDTGRCTAWNMGTRRPVCDWNGHSAGVLCCETIPGAPSMLFSYVQRRCCAGGESQTTDLPLSACLLIANSHGRDGLVKTWSLEDGGRVDSPALVIDTQSLTFCKAQLLGTMLIAPSRSAADVRTAMMPGSCPRAA